ncbi:hypothetical protein TNCT_299561 [Trichonephila clavata]|uniref:Uncharacterized protein n=1 Tax=Trichonephila clavata TaxID=2740835 RepID=A0A8X6HFK6_TRICU|nr:hypothetical protein TNCT_299561 [Trichonephila clavata]
MRIPCRSSSEQRYVEATLILDNVPVVVSVVVPELTDNLEESAKSWKAVLLDLMVIRIRLSKSPSVHSAI